MGLQDMKIFSGQELFLIKAASPVYAEDWRRDGHRWANRGTSQMKLKGKLVARHTYMYVMTAEGKKDDFQKHVYRLPDDDLKVVVQYIGNEKVLATV